MKNRKGFTLVELLAVIVILGILTLITVPIVSNYISDSRQKTYTAHEKTMEEAAKSLTVECINGKEVCDLPQEGQSNTILLSELIDKNFSQRLQNPQGSGYCNENLSYVTISNVGNSDYKYEACLYCGNYATESTSCSPINVNNDDRTPPVCGTIEGESSQWTNKPRTISVGCSDTGSGCVRTKFTKTFRTTLSTGSIKIIDKAGNDKDCPVNVKVDTTAPTCQLERVGGESESNGWYSGPVKIRFVSGSRNDSESGINTWGIGTSMEHPNYDRKELIDLTNINGVVTVFGYVKDNAGNEGTCSLNLRLGIQKPDFNIYYGYQVFPLKESYTTSNITVTSDKVLKTTSNNPTITFDNMDKYVNANRVVITTSSTVSSPTTYTLTVGSSTVRPRPLDSGKRLEFDIPRGTYSTYTFKMGEQSNVTTTINKIEIQQTKNNLPTNKNVTVNLQPVLSREKVKTSGFSYDNGSNFQTDYFKPFDVTNGQVSGVAQTKNDIPMYSDKKNYSIAAGDKSGPTISVSISPDSWTNGNVTITGKGKDETSGIIAYGFNKGSALSYVSSSWNSITLTKSEISKTSTASVNGTYYFNLKDEAGNTSNKSIVIDKIDKIKPECSISGNSKITCTDSSSDDYAASSIACYIFGKDATTSSTCTSVTATNSLTKDATVNSAGTWNLYAKDRAGNFSDAKSYVYYKVTYDKNGGASCTKTSSVLRSGQSVDLSIECSRDDGYMFGGWTLDGTDVTAVTITKSITLKAKWIPRKFNITYYPNGVSGSPTTKVVSAGQNWTTEGAIFSSNTATMDGWSTSATGSVTHNLSTAQGAYNRSSDLNLYAHWKDKTYKITYDKNGGSGTNTTDTVKYGATFKTKDKIFTKSGYKLVGWYQNIEPAIYYVDCHYKIYYSSEGTHQHYDYYSFRVEKLYSRDEANAYCRNHISDYKNSTSYSLFVDFIEFVYTNSPQTGTCKCSGQAASYTRPANSSSTCQSACSPNAQGIYSGTCTCYGGSQCNNVSTTNQSATMSSDACKSFCTSQSYRGCHDGRLSSTCTCKPKVSCNPRNIDNVSSESECASECQRYGCGSSYETESFDESKLMVTVDNAAPLSRHDHKGYSLSTNYTYTDTKDITLYADWRELASCPAGTTMVAGAGTDNPTCCTNCASVANGSCSVSADSNGKCKYTTKCDTGYTMVAGDGTNSPVCCKSCPTIANGLCTLSWDASSSTCKYATSCNPGYKLSGNGTPEAKCTRCPGWLLSNPNDPVFGSIQAAQGQKWTFKNSDDSIKKDGWINVYGDIYSNQVTSDTNGNGVCDSGTGTPGWFYMDKSTGIMKRGWACDGTHWFYLWTGLATGDFRDYPSGELSGRMVLNVTGMQLDGQSYDFDENGYCTSAACNWACTDEYKLK